jgi:hypothetical protein
MEDWGSGGVSESFFGSWVDCVNGWKFGGGGGGGGFPKKNISKKPKENIK